MRHSIAPFQTCWISICICPPHCPHNTTKETSGNSLAQIIKAKFGAVRHKGGTYTPFEIVRKDDGGVQNNWLRRNCRDFTFTSDDGGYELTTDEGSCMIFIRDIED